MNRPKKPRDMRPDTGHPTDDQGDAADLWLACRLLIRLDQLHGARDPWGSPDPRFAISCRWAAAQWNPISDRSRR